MRSVLPSPSTSPVSRARARNGVGYSTASAVRSEAVNSPVSTGRKHEFMIEPPTTASDGVPGMRIAPTPASPSLPPVPQLMLRLKKSEWRNPIVWPISWVMTCSIVSTLNELSPSPMLMVANGSPPDGKPDEPPTTPGAITALIVKLHPALGVRAIANGSPSSS